MDPRYTLGFLINVTVFLYPDKFGPFFSLPTVPQEVSFKFEIRWQIYTNSNRFALSTDLHSHGIAVNILM